MERKSLKPTLSLGQAFVLYDMGVRKIQVDYSGGGDSGQIDGVHYFNKDYNDISYKIRPMLDSLDTELCSDHIENIVYDQFLNDISDWYNNEGGQGSVTIEIPSLKVYGTTEYYHEANGVYDEETGSYEYDDDNRESWEEDYSGKIETYI